MKTTLLFALFGAALSFSAHAADSAPKLLAGVEAGVDTDSSMTVSDLNKTQEILASQATGAETSWYNIDTITHYDLIIGEHYSFDQRPCVTYQLTVQHSSKTAAQELNACLDYSGKWIAKLD